MGSSILNIGTGALLANQGALQTIGNNIANVNTPGYSRQSLVLQNLPGQFTGNGFYGKGVDVLTVTRAYSSFLTKQAAVSQSISASDTTRANSLKELENVVQGGNNGVGAAVSDMLNAFSDIVSSPTDLAARSVMLARADDMATRFRATATQLYEQKLGTINQLKTDATAINNLASQIAHANEQITRALASGHSPNDLLDQRDQMIRDLNQYVQTSNIQGDDGSITVFLASSQPLVLGKSAATVSIVNDTFNDPDKSKLAITISGSTTTFDESLLGGGEVSGLLHFQNTDLVDARNLLGRMAQAIGTKMNEQQSLGLDLNGNPGTALFSMGSLPGALAATTNTGASALSVSVQTSPSGTTAFSPSDYEFDFTSGTAGSVKRLSDGVVTAFDFSVTNPVKIDGLSITQSATPAVAGDRFVIKPFGTSALGINTAFSSPQGLAVASPVAANAGLANTGTLAVDGLAARSMPAPAAVTLTFTGPGTFTRSDTGATVYTYTPGVPIEYSAVLPPVTGWSLTLKGVAQIGDTYTVAPNGFPRLDVGNAQAMLNLRDLAMFDGATLTDGYANLMADIGTRVQSAKSSAAVSENIATSVEKDRTGVAGVNLDEEAAKMLQYQQAYQAAGKMMQVAQNIFDTLMQNLSH